MNILALTIGLFFPWLTGIGFLLLMPRGFGPAPRGWPWAVLCALPLGLVMHVLLASLLLILFPGWMHWSQVVIPELLLTGVMFTIGLRKYHQRSAFFPRANTPVISHSRQRVFHQVAAIVLTLVFFAGLYFQATRLFAYSELFPHGYSDAWHFWNFKARILAQGRDSWRWFLTDPEVPHQEYPIGFCVLIGRLYLSAGTFDSVLGKVVGLGSGIMCPILVWAAILRAKGSIHAACAGMLALAFPFSIIQAAWQYADVPLGALLITTLAWHYLYCRHHRSLPTATDVTQTRLAWSGFGFLLGSLLWTKNEGLVMAVAIVGYIFLVDWLSKMDSKVLLKRYIAAAVPLTMFAALYLSIKLNAHEPTDLINQHTIDKQLQDLFDIERLKIIGAYFADTFLHLFDWISCLLALAGLVFLGLDTRKSHLRPLIIYTFVLLTIAAVYIVAFLITPHDLQWHLRTATSRLMIQLWSSTVLAISLWMWPVDRVLRISARYC